MQVTISFRDRVLQRYGQQMAAIGAGKARPALSRALKHTGRKGKTRVVRALVPQTGLKRRTIVKAVREVRSNVDDLSFALETRGGDIRLKYFRARETRKGVSAAPWSKRQVYASTFQKAGWWPKRVVKPMWNRQVFKRIGAKTRSGMDKFEVQRSGLYIPTEMLTGASAQAWDGLINSDLLPRVEHELSRLLP